MFKDKEYFQTLSRIAVPIVIQNLVYASLNMVDVMMIGQLGETAVASVGLANEIYFLVVLLLFGISSGSAIFIAQYWGKRDVPNLRRVMGVSLALSLCGSGLFASLALFLPQTVLGIYSKDPAVIALGSQYLSIAGISYLLGAVTITYSITLRSVERPQLPMITSAIALTMNTTLNYLLIFGNFGFPQLGVTGAAISTVIARSFEMVLILGLSYGLKTPAAARLKELNGFNRPFLKKYLKTTVPVILNEAFWSLGITTYNIVYARIGTESIAAVNIANSIQNIAFVLFSGIANGTAVMIGNKIGEGKEERTNEYARLSLLLALIGAVLVGSGVALSAGRIARVYKISEQTRNLAIRVMFVQAAMLWSKVANMTMVVGIFRSGGDTRFAMFLDAGMVWVLGIPMAFLGAFVFDLPVYWVMLMVNSEEVLKAVIGFFRVRSRKWINNLVQTPDNLPVV